MSAADTLQQPDRPPAFMAHLVDRAAAMLLARWPCTQVEFRMWHAGGAGAPDGEYLPYLARLHWGFGDRGPRVLVFDGRSGDYVCRSHVGTWDAIDPSSWVLDTPLDEVERYEWAEGVHPLQRNAQDVLAGLRRPKKPTGDA